MSQTLHATTKETRNAPHSVEQRDVQFTSAGETLRGHLFLPADRVEGQRLPAVIVTGSWTTVKEQMPDLYAWRLAEQGFAALTFDFRHYGESGGQPREYENPPDKIEDIRSAVEFLQTVPEVDTRRIGGLGVCFSTGLMAAAANDDARIRSVALVAPWLHNREILKTTYGPESEWQRRYQRGQAAQEKYQQTGEVEYMIGASTTDPNAAMLVPDTPEMDYYLNPARGAIPQWADRVAAMSWVPWGDFDGVAEGKRVHVPILLIHSEDAAIPQGAKQFYADVTAPKSFYWTYGTQLDFYDQEPQVTVASSAAATHFATTL